MYSTIKEWLVAIIGEYTPDLTATDWGQIDFVWITSAVLLIVLVVVFFKALRFVIGGLSK